MRIESAGRRAVQPPNSRYSRDELLAVRHALELGGIEVQLAPTVAIVAAAAPNVPSVKRRDTSPALDWRRGGPPPETVVRRVAVTGGAGQSLAAPDATDVRQGLQQLREALRESTNKPASKRQSQRTSPIPQSASQPHSQSSSGFIVRGEDDEARPERPVPPGLRFSLDEEQMQQQQQQTPPAQHWEDQPPARPVHVPTPGKSARPHVDPVPGPADDVPRPGGPKGYSSVPKARQPAWRTSQESAATAATIEAALAEIEAQRSAAARAAAASQQAVLPRPARNAMTPDRKSSPPTSKLNADSPEFVPQNLRSPSKSVESSAVGTVSVSTSPIGASPEALCAAVAAAVATATKRCSAPLEPVTIDGVTVLTSARPSVAPDNAPGRGVDAAASYHAMSLEDQRAVVDLLPEALACLMRPLLPPQEPATDEPAATDAAGDAGCPPEHEVRDLRDDFAAEPTAAA